MPTTICAISIVVVNWKMERSFEVCAAEVEALGFPERDEARRAFAVGRRREEVEPRRRDGVQRGERDFLAEADIEHVARAQRMALTACLDAPLAADVDDHELAPLQERGRARGLDRLQLQRLAEGHGAAEDHVVVMGVGEAEPAGLEEVADMEVAAQLGRVHRGGRGGIDGEADGVFGAHGVLPRRWVSEAADAR